MEWFLYYSFFYKLDLLQFILITKTTILLQKAYSRVHIFGKSVHEILVVGSPLVDGQLSASKFLVDVHSYPSLVRNLSVFEED